MVSSSALVTSSPGCLDGETHHHRAQANGEADEVHPGWNPVLDSYQLESHVRRKSSWMISGLLPVLFVVRRRSKTASTATSAYVEANNDALPAALNNTVSAMLAENVFRLVSTNATDAT